MARGVRNVWLDEAELKIDDSLTGKIEDGLTRSRYTAVVLSPGFRRSTMGPQRT